MEMLNSKITINRNIIFLRNEIHISHRFECFTANELFLSFFTVFDYHFKIPIVQKAVLIDAYCDPTSILLVLK